jgi:hypothetical protein
MKKEELIKLLEALPDGVDIFAETGSEDSCLMPVVSVVDVADYPYYGSWEKRTHNTEFYIST